MRKSTVTKVWIAGAILMVAGLIFGGIFLAVMLTNGGHWEQVGNTTNWNFVPSRDNTFWTALSLMITGFVVAAAGGIVQTVAWIGAVANVAQLADKTWFWVLLIGGLLSLAFGPLGFAAMVAYLIAGPADHGELQRGQAYPTYPQPPMQRPPTLAPTA
jgi:H+/Cl- antiporter ClcA